MKRTSSVDTVSKQETAGKFRSEMWIKHFTKINKGGAICILILSSSREAVISTVKDLKRRIEMNQR